MASLKKRIELLEQRSGAGQNLGSLADSIREGRLRAQRGEPPILTPITQEMLDHPIHGEMWRNIRNGRERVRKAREQEKTTGNNL